MSEPELDREAYEFLPPTSPAECVLFMDEIKADIGEINSQLASRKQIDPETGLFMADAVYQKWRGKAVAAQIYKQKRLADLKRWKKENTPPPEKSQWGDRQADAMERIADALEDLAEFFIPDTQDESPS